MTAEFKELKVLKGIKVLVVEDEYFVAILIEEILQSAGCIVMGPIPRLPEALDAVDHEDYDAAVLDVNLAGERIDPRHDRGGRAELHPGDCNHAARRHRAADHCRGAALSRDRRFLLPRGDLPGAGQHARAD